MHRAVQLPALENSARNLYLNQRVSIKSPFLSPSVWARNDGPVDINFFLDGRPVYGGLEPVGAH